MTDVMGLTDKMSYLGGYKTVKDAKKRREVVKRGDGKFLKGENYQKKMICELIYEKITIFLNFGRYY